MDIDELQTVQNKERQKDSLQHLRDSFYEDVAAYVAELKAERDRAAEETTDPFSDPAVSRLTDDIERAEDVVEAVYERRVGKVVKLASFAAADMPVDEEGLTAQERDLFEDLVGRIGENRSRVLDILAGNGDAPAASPTGADPAGTAPDSRPDPTDEVPGADAGATATPSRAEPAVGTGEADVDSAVEEPAAPPELPPESPPEEPAEGETPDAEAADPRSDGGTEAEQPHAAATPPGAEATAAGSDADAERTTVRITADVGRLLGVDDREYELKREDVVSLPADNADALLQREAAEQLW